MQYSNTGMILNAWIGTCQHRTSSGSGVESAGSLSRSSRQCVQRPGSDARISRALLRAIDTFLVRCFEQLFYLIISPSAPRLADYRRLRTQAILRHLTWKNWKVGFLAEFDAELKNNLIFGIWGFWTGHIWSGMVTPGPRGQVWSPQVRLVTCGHPESIWSWVIVSHRSRIWSGLATKCENATDGRTDIASTRPVGFASGKERYITCFLPNGPTSYSLYQPWYQPLVKFDDREWGQLKWKTAKKGAWISNIYFIRWVRVRYPESIWNVRGPKENCGHHKCRDPYSGVN